MARAMGGMSSDPIFNPNLFVLSSFVQGLKKKLDIVGQNQLNYRVKFGLVTTVQDWVQEPHLDCDVTPGNHDWISHMPLCTSGSYLYIWDEVGTDKNLVFIPLGSFLVLRDDVWHDGLCGGKGNLWVHGGIFDSVAIQTTTNLTYPDSMSLANYMKGHNSVHNKRGEHTDYDTSIDLLGKETSDLLGQMVSTIQNSFAFPNGFFEKLLLGHRSI